MAVIVLESVEKKFGPTKALSMLNLRVEDHELVVIVGPSGSGKSTLLRIIAGLENPTSGRVTINGRDMAGVLPKDRNLAMVFQSHALYPHMTVYNNLAFNLRIRGLPKGEITRRVADAAKRLEITELLKRRPHQMSGGQRQRVAIGRALVRDPEAFLFDEPLSNLDAELRVRLRTEIKRLHHELHRTAIYVTHDQVEAMSLADRIVVLRDGRIEQIGAPADLYERPGNTFVASFIGSPAMNMIAGELADGHVRIGPEAFLPMKADREGPVIVGLRPEDILIANESDSGAFSACAALVEPMGADAVVQCQMPGGCEVSIRVAHYQRVTEGNNLALKVREGACHLFDRDSGQRIG
jgi:ABC-type sugar transport system ATPase subunit